MADTKIEWADKAWNPITGCTPVSEGCEHCYAARMAKRLAGRCGYPADRPFRVTFHTNRLFEPMHWRKARRVFTCSMGDLFHKDVESELREQAYGVMALARHLTFIVLTKRPEQMNTWSAWEHTPARVSWRVHEAANRMGIDLRQKWPDLFDADRFATRHVSWPLPNVWLGVSVENQERADERIPILLQCPAAVRFVSVEPMLSRLDLSSWLGYNTLPSQQVRRLLPSGVGSNSRPSLDLVICGAETGPGARPMDLDWARDLRDQCGAADVPFFFKSAGPGKEIPADLQIREFPDVQA